MNFINPERRAITISKENFRNILGKEEKIEMVLELDQNSDAHVSLDIAKDEAGFSLRVMQ